MPGYRSQILSEFVRIRKVVGIPAIAPAHIPAFRHEPGSRVGCSFDMVDVTVLSSPFQPPLLSLDVAGLRGIRGRRTPHIGGVVVGIESPINAGLVGHRRRQTAVKAQGAVRVLGPVAGHGGSLPHERIAICHVRGIATAYVVANLVETKTLLTEDARIEILTKLPPIGQSLGIGLRVSAGLTD